MARPAAVAALAAGEQGKYWEFHKKLYENYNRLSDSMFLDLAKSLGLDEAAFSLSLKDPRHQQAIQKDMQDGQAAGVTGTPSVFINGRRLKTRSLAGFKAIIDAELAKSAAMPIVK
jgi:protein-disulfide isomerase